MDEKSTWRQKIPEEVKKLRMIDDNFMSAVFEDVECAQLLIRIILDKELTVISSKTQYSIKNLQGHSIRLDIYAEDENGTKYNIEVQRRDSGSGPKRARYHSSLMDAGILDPAEDYSAIPESYVIFITENDVLKGSKPIYHIERCVLETNTPFNDGAHIVYVNSQIQDETALGRLMQDFYRTSADEMNYQLLAERVKYFKEDMKGVDRMCEAVEKLCNEARLEGKVETTLKFIKSAMSQLKMTASEAMKLAGVEPNEQKIYLDMLEAE